MTRPHRRYTTLATFKVLAVGLTVYPVAVPDWLVVTNRYGGRIVGCGVVTGPVAWSFTWRRP